MRLFLTTAVTVGFMLVSAASASAISIFFGAPSATALNVGDTFTIQMRMDTQGETDLTSLFVSAAFDPSVISFVSGNSPGSILFNFSTFSGISRVSQPFVNGGDPAGHVRAVSFSATGTSGSGVSSGNQLLSTLTFQAVGGGSTSIQSLLQTGDDVTVGGVSVAGGVTFGSSAPVTVVPEPGTALLMSLGLLGLAASGRRA